jgi:hypothetical protein
MVDQLALQTISIVIAATSVVIGVINSILVSRRDERRQNLLLKNQELSLETRQIGLYMDFTKVIQQSIDDYTDFFNQEWEDFEDYSQKYGQSSNPEAFNKFIRLADVFQSLGAFVEDGVFDIKTVYNHSGFSIIPAWEKMEPLIRGMRTLFNNPTIYPQFEFLYNELIKYREKQQALIT